MTFDGGAHASIAAMDETPQDQARARLAETFAEVEDALLARWPETKLDPTLDRIEAFSELLGDPQGLPGRST